MHSLYAHASLSGPAPNKVSLGFKCFSCYMGQVKESKPEGKKSLKEA